MNLTGTLTSGRIRDFSGFLVTAEYQDIIVPADENTPAVTAAARSASNAVADGSFTLVIPEADARSGPISVGAFGPDGVVAGQTELPADTDGRNVRLAVTVAPPVVVEPSDDPTLGAQPKYIGRVIDTAGRPAPAGLVVVLWARVPNANKAAPISVATTAQNGYFSGPWPSEPYTEAFAVVAGGSPVPIPLLDNHLPRRIIVVLPELPAPPPKVKDCECPQAPPRAPDLSELGENPQAFADDIGRCVDFTIPNRAVEEVVYQAVVRTTQPALNPPTPPKKPPVPPFLVDRLVKLARLRPQAIKISTDLEPGAPSAQPTILLPRPTISTSGVFSPGGGAVLGSAFERATALTPGIDLNGLWQGGRPPDPGVLDSVLEARARNGKPVELEASVLGDLVRENRPLSPLRVLDAEHVSIVRRVRNAAERLTEAGAGRFALSDTKQIDWESIPERYQATTIAHGHVLSIKQVWRADGYSLGDLLYSLPLAPGQQKLMSVLDWDREEVTTRRAARELREQVTAQLARDRDISDIIRSSLSESLEARSHANVRAGGGALGGFIGPFVFGAAGGVSSAGSTASQTSGRSVAGSALNHVRDRTQQAASAVRAQRTTVVQTARQSESVRAQTEVIANYNHCHAVTVEYFEVLRHLQVTQELAHVQECLFVPFSISPFNADKALRWRTPLVQQLREPGLAWAFDAVERVRDNWEDADYPPLRYADERITYLDTEFRMRMSLPRPADDENDLFVAANWKPYEDEDLLGPNGGQDIWKRYLGGLRPQDREAVWETRIAPAVAQRLVEKLRMRLIRAGGSAENLDVDPTLVSQYRNDRPLLVSMRITPPLPNMTRAEIARVEIRFDGVTTLPAGAALRVDSATMSYRTDHYNGYLFQNRRVLNDLSLGQTGQDTVQIATPLTLPEKRNPREYDRRYAERLLSHLNEHVEYYHRAIWTAMDPNRRYLLLDGFVAPDAGGRSVASVVDNRVIGIVGNSLVMPVAPGQQLDPTYEFAEATPEDLRHLYAIEAAPPMRISIPTSGVFAEAVLGRCNSCEIIDDSRFWHWEDAPIPDRPTAIGALSLASRRQALPTLTADEFAPAIVRMQQIPEAPAPTGLAAAVQALGVGNIFKDLTGVVLNQQNAAQALKSSIKVAHEFAQRASALAQQKFLDRAMDRDLAAIKKARDQKLIDKEESQKLTEDLFRRAIGEKQPAQESPTKTPAVKRAIDRATKSREGSVRVTRPDGTVELQTRNRIGGTAIDVAIDPPISPIKQLTNMVCWAAGGAMMRSWQVRQSQTVEAFLDSLGGDWRTRYDKNEGLSPADFRVFMAAVGLTETPPQSFTPQGLARLLRAGPVLTVGDDGVRTNKVVHVRIVTQMKGDGTPSGTQVIAADSASGTELPFDFVTFARNLEAPEPVATGLGVFQF
jgi:Papain-like cysteine protease AvrRpt2